MKRIVLFIVLLLPGVMMHAQYNLKQNNVWAFGSHYGLDFNSGTPVPISTSLITLGGSASVSDANGQLLFYTQGDTIWNRNHQIMPNGSEIIAPYISNGNGTQSEQGQLIVPVINNPDQYYVFSIQNGGDYYFGIDAMACRLFYSAVDMSLDGGLGDVVAGQKNIQIDSSLSPQKLIAVAGNNCNIWMITHSIMGNDFKVFEINSNGISANPVTSTVGNLSGGIAYVEGKLRISPDRMKLFAPSAYGFSLQEIGAELYDFDATTGVVSNAVLLDTAVICFAGCFSPDNSKLYTIESDNTFTYLVLCQYDLSQSSTAAIIGSKINLDTSNTFNYIKDVKLGPDGKVYVNFDDPQDTLSVVNSPNLAGTACNYVSLALPVSLFTGAPLVANGCLPNEFVIPIPDTLTSSTDTSLAAATPLVLDLPAGFQSYLWSDGSTGNSFSANDTGTYWVVYKEDYCTVRMDTFVVHYSLSTGDLANSKDISVYPNPATSLVIITIEGLSNSSGTLRLMDALGNKVLERKCLQGRYELDVTGLANGVYMIRYIDNENPALKLSNRLLINR
jgi:hypothetical protein